MKRKHILALIIIMAFAAIIVYYNPNIFGIIQPVNGDAKPVTVADIWIPLLVWSLVLFIVGIVLYGLLVVVVSWLKHKGGKSIFGLFKGEEVKTLPQQKRIEIAWQFCKRHIHNVLPTDPEFKSNGDTISLVDIYPSPIRKDTVPLEMYVFKWGDHKVGFRDIPGKAEARPHKMYYVLQNCKNGDCFPLGFVDYKEAVSMLNNTWFGSWKKFEENKFVSALQDKIIGGFAEETGRQAAKGEKDEKQEESSGKED